MIKYKVKSGVIYPFFGRKKKVNNSIWLSSFAILSGEFLLLGFLIYCWIRK